MQNQNEGAMITWQWLRFDALDAATLYAVLAARQEVFVLEQQCLYADIDSKDQRAFHLIARQPECGQLMAYLRCFAPDDECPQVVLGRVLTVPAVRGLGLGKQLMAEAMRRVALHFPGAAVRISAQEHLADFYAAFGFRQVSERYLEDGIPHIAMLRQ